MARGLWQSVSPFSLFQSSQMEGTQNEQNLFQATFKTLRFNVYILTWESLWGSPRGNRWLEKSKIWQNFDSLQFPASNCRLNMNVHSMITVHSANLWKTKQVGQLRKMFSPTIKKEFPKCLNFSKRYQTLRNNLAKTVFKIIFQEQIYIYLYFISDKKGVFS